MAQAKQGDSVKVHYTGKLEDGTVFDSSEGRPPLEFKLGEGKIIPGFESGIVGMSPGDSRTITIPAEQAYGPHAQDKVLTVERSQIPADLSPKVGMQLEVRQQGQAIPVRVTDVSDSSVTLDANHPLAGKDLIFDTQLVEIA